MCLTLLRSWYRTCDCRYASGIIVARQGCWRSEQYYLKQSLPRSPRSAVRHAHH